VHSLSTTAQIPGIQNRVYYHAEACIFEAHKDKDWLKDKYDPSHLEAVIQRRNENAKATAKELLLDHTEWKPQFDDDAEVSGKQETRGSYIVIFEVALEHKWQFYFMNDKWRNDPALRQQLQGGGRDFLYSKQRFKHDFSQLETNLTARSKNLTNLQHVPDVEQQISNLVFI
jgi:hypothetical protein